MSRSGLLRQMDTIRSPSGNGSPLYMAPLTMLNTVVVSPMPREKATMAMRESTGELMSMRTPYLTSLKKPSMAVPFNP